SSRRRHTRSKRDWSSDVCSSDLPGSVFKYDTELFCRNAITEYDHRIPVCHQRYAVCDFLLHDQRSETRHIRYIESSRCKDAYASQTDVGTDDTHHINITHPRHLLKPADYTDTA